MAYGARLRIELPAVPGALGRVAGVLGGRGGTVVGVDVHEVDGDLAGGPGRGAVEIVVDLPDDISPAEIGAALARDGCGTLLTAGPARPWADLVLRTLRWTTAVAEVHPDDRAEELARALADLCAATAWVTPAEEARGSKAGRLALERSAPVAVAGAEVPVAVAPGLALGAELVAVPGPGDPPVVVAFLARAPGAPFTRTEIERAAALLSALAATGALPSGVPSFSGY